MRFVPAHPGWTPPASTPDVGAAASHGVLVGAGGAGLLIGSLAASAVPASPIPVNPDCVHAAEDIAEATIQGSDRARAGQDARVAIDFDTVLFMTLAFSKPDAIHAFARITLF